MMHRCSRLHAINRFFALSSRNWNHFSLNLNHWTEFVQSLPSFLTLRNLYRKDLDMIDAKGYIIFLSPFLISSLKTPILLSDLPRTQRNLLLLVNSAPWAASFDSALCGFVL